VTETNTILPLTSVLEPADEAAVAQAARDAFQSATPIYPLGGQTKLNYGSRAIEPGIGISLEQLGRVIEYSPDDLTITAQAGVTLAELRRCLAERKQRISVDFPWAEQATLGGLLATNVCGPRQYAHGTIGDYVLGMKVVDGRGATLDFGGRVLSSAAGYNLYRLMVGSLGTLGLIAQATLSVGPMPETSAFVACDLPDFETAEQLLAALVRTQTLPAAVELLAGADRRMPPVLEPLADGQAARLLVGYEGSDSEVRWMVDQIQREFRECGNSSVKTISEADAEIAWTWLAEFPAEVQISVLPSATAGLVAELLNFNAGFSIQAHAGNGLIRLRLPDGPPEQFIAQVRHSRWLAVEAGGSAVVLSAPPGIEINPEDIWGDNANNSRILRAIKDRFDPKGILNPGRFLGFC
jgi:glycolate oxidase FAD binding subunit